MKTAEQYASEILDSSNGRFGTLQEIVISIAQRIIQDATLCEMTIAGELNERVARLQRCYDEVKEDRDEMADQWDAVQSQLSTASFLIDQLSDALRIVDPTSLNTIFSNTERKNCT